MTALSATQLTFFVKDANCLSLTAVRSIAIVEQLHLQQEVPQGDLASCDEGRASQER